VFGLERDVVDLKVEVLVESWIREPMKFDDPENLKEQMKSDEKTIKQLFRIDCSS
jgi:FAD synthase